MKNQNSNKLAISSLLAAVSASLCCITPILAILAGTSGLASTFSWLEPFRPYLIGLTVLVLGFAWWQKLKPKTAEEIECECEDDEMPSFWQSKKFLAGVTIFAALMLAFPYYSGTFYSSDNNQKTLIVKSEDVQSVVLDVEGMTCKSCDNTVEHSVNKIEGVITAKADHKTGKANVEFDSSRTNKKEISEAINGSGFKVIKEANQ